MRRLITANRTKMVWCRSLCSAIKWIILILTVIALAAGTFYVLWFTPLAVYVLDRVNLRLFFLPNIICDGCNNFTYPFMVSNRNFCTDLSGRLQPVFLLILVTSYHPNVNARQAIRQSWGGLKEYRDHAIRTLFIFGRHEDTNYNYQIQYELQHYGDVIQADFADSYQSLTNKTVSGLRWVEEFCPSAKFVLKTDDDAFNVPQRFVDYLLGVGTGQFIGGYCFTVLPDRRESSKFYVPYSLYPDKYYPTYCSGPGYVMSKSAVVSILSVSSDVSFLPMEDVFVTGVCRLMAGISYTQVVGVVEDQRQMSRCGLATWVKNGHHIYPGATPGLWAKTVDADSARDCVVRNRLLLCQLVLLIAIWLKHLYIVIQSGFHRRV